ncbi:MAG: hypothetical protein KC442_18815 [Thermomicrobiales bacterium]|nr:hypothetical protein [Thermomicrobiales bacterium]
MDANRFDVITAHLATPLSRRRSAGLLALLGLGSLVADDAEARRRRKKKKKKNKKHGKKNKKKQDSRDKARQRKKELRKKRAKSEEIGTRETVNVERMADGTTVVTYITWAE